MMRRTHFILLMAGDPSEICQKISTGTKKINKEE
jgi:hypothetical protein